MQVHERPSRLLNLAQLQTVGVSILIAAALMHTNDHNHLSQAPLLDHHESCIGYATQY